MDDKTKAALRAKTDNRPPDFLSDVREYDGRSAKEQWRKQNQGTGSVMQKICI